jgi:hypothetical protein
MWDPQEQRHSNALIDGRQDNMVRFKPGVQAMMLLFSDQAGRRVFKFPYWDYFAAQMEPLLEEVGVLGGCMVHGAWCMVHGAWCRRRLLCAAGACAAGLLYD